MSDILRGKRYINLLRSSTLLNDTSTEDQKKVNDLFANEHDMVPVRDVVLKGVSGAKTFNRRDLKALLQERRHNKNYDVIVVYDSSRLTRGGAGHGAAIRREFAKVGVLILSVMDPIPEGDFKDVMQSVIDTNNYLYSRRLSGYITRGIVQAILRGDSATQGMVPLGIDRLYIRPSVQHPTGEAFLRLRYAGNRVRQLIDERTHTLIRELRSSADGVVAYRKMDGEKVRLVPGDEKVVAAVREAFDLRYRHGWAYHRIARHFVARGICPQCGTIWRGCIVRGMLLNPMYLGWNFFLKDGCGLYHVGHRDRPKERHIDQGQLEEQNRESVPHEKRHVSEMIRVEQPGLKEFITDPVVRQRAEEVIKRYFDEYHIPKSRTVPTGFQRHPNSRHFLRGLLRMKGLNLALVAHSYTDKKKKERRYYVVSGDFASASMPARRTVPAEPMEKAVLGILRSVFSNHERVQQMIRTHVATALTVQGPQINREKLLEEHQEVKDRLHFIFANASKRERDDLKPLVVQLQKRREEIERELALAPITAISGEFGDVSLKVMAAIFPEDGKMGEQCYEKLRSLLALVCRNFFIDLNTLEAELEVGLPDFFLRASADEMDQYCLTDAKVHSSIRRANIPWITLAKFHLTPAQPRKSGCRMGYDAFDWAEVQEERDTSQPHSPPKVA